MKALVKSVVASALEAAIPLDALDWQAIESDLDAYGCAVAPRLLSREACRELQALYADDARFRSRIVMARSRLRPGRVQIFRRPAA